MVSSFLERLKCFNDSNFKFDEPSHSYTYGGKSYTSVTRFISNFHQEFDSDYWSNKKSIEVGITQDEILDIWKEKNERANFVGHSTHLWIENYFKKIPQSLPTDLDIIDRINKFNIIYAKELYKLTPLSFEIKIFSKRFPLAGTIDSIFIYNGKLFIIDYKTNGNFTHNEHPKGKYQKLLYPFNSYFKNHLNEYSIQVSLYSLILKEWGFDIRAGYLLHIGPDSEPQLYKCEDLVSILEEYLPTHQF